MFKCRCCCHVPLDLLKIPRLLRLGRLTRKMSIIAAARAFRIAMLLFAYVLIGHILCCGFFYLGMLLQQVMVPFSRRLCATAASALPGACISLGLGELGFFFQPLQQTRLEPLCGPATGPALPSLALVCSAKRLMAVTCTASRCG